MKILSALFLSLLVVIVHFASQPAEAETYDIPVQAGLPLHPEAPFRSLSSPPCSVPGDQGIYLKHVTWAQFDGCWTANEETTHTWEKLCSPGEDRCTFTYFDAIEHTVVDEECGNGNHVYQDSDAVGPFICWGNMP